MPFLRIFRSVTGLPRRLGQEGDDLVHPSTFASRIGVAPVMAIMLGSAPHLRSIATVGALPASDS